MSFDCLHDRFVFCDKLRIYSFSSNIQSGSGTSVRVIVQKLNQSFIIRRLKDHIMKRLVCLCDTCYIVTVKHLFKSGSSGMKFVYFLLINAVTRKLYGKFFKRTPNFQYVAQIFL